LSARLRLPLLLVVVAALSAGDAVAQCSMCRAVLEGAVEGKRIAEGLNHGILLMMAAPYLIIATFLALTLRPRLRAAFARLRAARPGALAAGE
jgi:hypothetical protein